MAARARRRGRAAGRGRAANQRPVGRSSAGSPPINGRGRGQRRSAGQRLGQPVPGVASFAACGAAGRAFPRRQGALCSHFRAGPGRARCHRAAPGVTGQHRPPRARLSPGSAGGVPPPPHANGEGVSVSRFPAVPRAPGAAPSEPCGPGLCRDQVGLKPSCKKQAADTDFYFFFPRSIILPHWFHFYFIFFLATLLTEINLSVFFC